MKNIVLPLLLLLSLPSIADNDLAIETLNSSLDTMIDFKSSSTIEFCPSQKCETFNIQEPNPDFPSYVFLHIYHNNKYVTLEELVLKEQRFQQNTRKAEETIRNKVAHYCKEENVTAQCVLSGMRNTLGIKLCWANYDEGNYCVVCDGNTQCKKL